MIGQPDFMCVRQFFRHYMRSPDLSLSGGTALSADNRYLAVARQFVFQVYDVDTGVVSRTFKHKLATSTDHLPVVFAHGGLALLSIYDKGSIRLWDMMEQVKLQTLPSGELLIETWTI